MPDDNMTMNGMPEGFLMYIARHYGIGGIAVIAVLGGFYFFTLKPQAKNTDRLYGMMESRIVADQEALQTIAKSTAELSSTVKDLDSAVGAFTDDMYRTHVEMHSKLDDAKDDRREMRSVLNEITRRSEAASR